MKRLNYWIAVLFFNLVLAGCSDADPSDAGPADAGLCDIQPFNGTTEIEADQVAVFSKSFEATIEYMYCATEPEWVFVRLGFTPTGEPTGMGPDLFLYDPNGELYIDFQDEPFWHYPYTRAGAVYLPWAGPWTLQVSMQSWNSMEDECELNINRDIIFTSEPDSNDDPLDPFPTIGDMSELNRVHSYVGVALETDTDQDWIRIPHSVTTWPIYVVASYRPTSVSTTIRATLLDPFGVEVFQTDDLASNPILHWGVASGDYLLRMENAENPLNGPNWFMISTWIYGDKHLEDVPWETEPNDTMGTAQTLADFSESNYLDYRVVGDLLPQDDCDWFSFDVLESSGITVGLDDPFDMFFHPGGDSVPVIYDESGQLVSLVMDDLYAFYGQVSQGIHYAEICGTTETEYYNLRLVVQPVG